MIFRSLRHLILITPFLFLGCDESDVSVSVPEEVNWISDNAYKPTSVDPNNTNFEDLQFLKTVIGDRRLVMLGEQTHGDGTTFSAKIRLIKFLHQEMGFDIIAWESGVYNCHKSWLEMKSGKDGRQAVKKSINTVWSDTQEVYPLFDYMDDAPYSLELIGMDPQFFGDFDNELGDDLEAFLQSRNSVIVNEADWADNKSLLKDLLNAERDPAALGEVTLNNASTLIEALTSEITMFDQTPQVELLNDPEFWLQVLYNIKITTQIHQLWKAEDHNGSLIRDEAMGNNMSWIMDRYPDRKIIVWAASTHISRDIDDVLWYNSNTKDYFNLLPYKQMGEYVFEKYGDEMYAIGFTAYQGRFYNYLTGKFDKINTHDGSLEDYLNQTNEEYLFIDYRGNLPDWMKGVFVSTVFAYNNAKNDWTNSLDGIFYTRNMEASNFRP